MYADNQDTIDYLFRESGLGRYIDNLTYGQATDVLGMMGGFVSGLTRKPLITLLSLGIALAPEGTEIYHQGLSGLESFARDGIKDVGAILTTAALGYIVRGVFVRKKKE